VNWLTRMVLVTCESVIVPVQAEPYALQGLRDLIPMLDRMTATAQLFRIVINMYRQNTGLHQTVLREIEQEYPGRVARQKVRLTIQLAEAAREGLSVFEYAPACTGALDLYALCFELFKISPEQVKAHAQGRSAAMQANLTEARALDAEVAETGVTESSVSEPISTESSSTVSASTETGLAEVTRSEF
jgi:hypothetical protein